MKTKLLSLLLIGMPLAQTFACQACFGDYRGVTGGPPANIQHMAIAVWLMMAFTGCVFGGLGAFSFCLWRRSRMPLQPHEKLAEEDLSQYA
ncbi:MAG: hypothetical protein JO354_11690 [Verrucomicrobia bacterium]|nr:hypothetical protein [Verrucomicrobiota bacterium]